MELENWIQKYDREMGEKQDELEQLQTEFTEESSELKELEEKLEVCACARMTNCLVLIRWSFVHAEYYIMGC